ncbi:MAG: DNA-directed RNA polymerase subunit delta [Erysipelotrichia bacterium]|nr:DNA-directed RNA polymerase subunit delta [Erysipelotrichia bacterium]
MSVRAIDVAYNLLLDCKEGMPFKDLWEKVKTEMGYDEKMASKKISQFYTNLSLDGRFVNLDNNFWNLKSHCKYDEVAVTEEDLQEIDDSDDENDDEYQEDEVVENEEDEY